MLPSYYLSYHHKNKFRLYALMVAAVVAVILNLTLIPTYGPKGAAVSFIFAMFSYATSIGVFVYYQLKKIDN
jgi:O-antigen/teichoic acid export membrane protein